MDSRPNVSSMFSSDKIARLGWIVALIMMSIAILLAIRLVNVNNSVNFGDVRDEIRAVCTTPSPENNADCNASLERLYTLLAEIQTEREEAAKAAAAAEAPIAPVAPAATSTATVTPAI